MNTPVKTPLPAEACDQTDPLPSRESLIAENERLRQELARVKLDSSLSAEQYSRLVQNMPLSAQEDDYSAVKLEIDRLISTGIENLHEYFLAHPDFLREMVVKIEIVSVNKSLLDIHRAENSETFILADDEVDDWWGEQWVEYYAAEFSSLAEGKAYYDSERADTRIDGSPLVSRSVCFLVAGCEQTWERVITMLWVSVPSV